MLLVTPTITNKNAKHPTISTCDRKKGEDKRYRESGRGCALGGIRTVTSESLKKRGSIQAWRAPALSLLPIKERERRHRKKNMILPSAGGQGAGSVV